MPVGHPHCLHSLSCCTKNPNGYEGAATYRAVRIDNPLSNPDQEVPLYKDQIPKRIKCLKLYSSQTWKCCSSTDSVRKTYLLNRLIPKQRNLGNPWNLTKKKEWILLYLIVFLIHPFGKPLSIALKIEHTPGIKCRNFFWPILNQMQGMFK